MSKNLMQAHHQWSNRPDDERFLSLEELHTATLDRAERCDAQVLEHNSIEIQGRQNGGRILTASLPGLETELAPTHWSFSQLASRARVPAAFCRTTHPAIAADALNYGLRYVAERGESLVQVHQRTDGELEIRALTGPTYGRIYDHRVVEAVRDVNDASGNRWVIPAGSTITAEEARTSKRATTLYASDRDVFIFLVDPSTPIEIPAPQGGTETLWRGFMAWNSEVGASVFGIRTFLYRHVCDNRIIWGAEHVQCLKIRHTSGGPDRFRLEGAKMLKTYAESSSRQTAERVRRSMELEAGRTDDDVEAFLRKRQFTTAEAKRIITRAKEEEGQARTVWDLVQGGTALARGIQHTDTRIQAEERVSRLMDLTT